MWRRRRSTAVGSFVWLPHRGVARHAVAAELQQSGCLAAGCTWHATGSVGCRPAACAIKEMGSQVRLRPFRQGRKCDMHLYAQTGSPLCLPTCGRAMGCHRCVVSSCHPSAALQAAGCGLDVSIGPKGTRSAQALISSPHFNMLYAHRLPQLPAHPAAPLTVARRHDHLATCIPRAAGLDGNLHFRAGGI